MQQAPAKKSSKVEGKKNRIAKRSKNHYKLHNIALVLIIFILTISIVLGSILLFNIGGAKPLVLKMIYSLPLIGNVVKPMAENKTPEQIEMEKLQVERNDIAVQFKQLEENRKALEERENIISEKEELLAQKEEQINERLEQLNTRFNSIKEQTEYLEKMESSKAVQIISNMESKGAVVQILRNMNKEKSSSILMLMDPLQAAQVLEDISKPEKEGYLND